MGLKIQQAILLLAAVSSKAVQFSIKRRVNTRQKTTTFTLPKSLNHKSDVPPMEVILRDVNFNRMPMNEPSSGPSDKPKPSRRMFTIGKVRPAHTGVNVYQGVFSRILRTGRNTYIAFKCFVGGKKIGNFRRFLNNTRP